MWQTEVDDPKTVAIGRADLDNLHPRLSGAAYRLLRGVVMVGREQVERLEFAVRVQAEQDKSGHDAGSLPKQLTERDASTGQL
ncbi:protein of unknown function [Paraburkholderia kururiensis]